ncbi:MAG: zinc-ribbon domain-containing protein [Anaerolineae bacterium]|nr:zinc-ribbon domain-containing protein [Anaerolineae bacterium]
MKKLLLSALLIPLLLLQARYIVTIGQVDVSNLPDVTVFVNVTDDAGNPITSLQQSDFSLSEDGKPVEITEFAGIGESRPVDVVFVFDTTGSMDEEIQGVINSCIDFAEALEASGRDYRLGLVTFGDGIRGVYNRDGSLTADVNQFKEWVSSLIANGGADDPENSFGALKQASQMIFRTDSQVIFIHITDAPAHEYGDSPDDGQLFDDPDLTYERTLALLQAPRQITVYAVTLNDSNFRKLATETGGRFYDIDANPDFTDIIDTIGTTIATQYRITYTTPRPDFDGTRRNIEVRVGESAGIGGYLEPHLINLRSNLLVGLLCLIPLIAALVIPLAGRLIFRKQPAAAPASVAPPVPYAPSPVAPAPAVPTALSPGSAPTAVQNLCPQCGRPVRANAKFCAACGTSIAEVPASQAATVATTGNTCARCGSPVRAGAKFCPNCGSRQ